MNKVNNVLNQIVQHTEHNKKLLMHNNINQSYNDSSKMHNNHIQFQNQVHDTACFKMDEMNAICTHLMDNIQHHGKEVLKDIP